MNPSFLRSLGVDLLDLLAPRRCAACGTPWPAFPTLRTGALCEPCALSLEPPAAAPRDVVVPYAHEGPLARAIVRAKFGDDPGIARSLAPLLTHATHAKLGAFDLVVAVPLHPRRLARRGFNQSVELARAMPAPVAHGVLARTRDTPSQRGLGRHERHANVRGAFVVRSPRTLVHRSIVLIDDVVTTGATLLEAAQTLRHAGAARVVCVALAAAPLEHG